jgi:hypothetical protein
MEFNFESFSDTSALNLNGSANIVDGLRLTPKSDFEAGSAFYKTSFKTDTDWQTHFQFQIDSLLSSGGGDGFAFILQNETASPNFLGVHGGFLGYGSYTPSGQSFAVEFDTFKNSWDSDNNHVAFLKNRDVTQHLASATPSLDLNSGELVSVWIDYDGQTKQVSLYLSNNNVKPTDSLLSAEVDLPTLVGSEALLGFSGGTGGKYDEHSIKNWSFESEDEPNLNHPPQAPSIFNPPLGTLLDPTSFKFQLPENFTLNDPDGDRHDHTDYEIWLEGENKPAWVAHDIKDDFFKIHAIFPTTGTFVNSHEGRNSLLSDKEYTLKVRVADPWGAESLWTEQIHRTAPDGTSPPDGGIPWEVLEEGYAIELVAEGLKLPAQLDFNTKNGLIIGAEVHDGPFTVDSSGNIHRLAKLVDYDPGDDIGGESERGAIGIVYDRESHSLFQGVLDANSYPVIYRLFLSDDGLSVVSTQKIWEYRDQGKQAHQITNLAIQDSYLYVNMGDAFRHKTARDLTSPWGKILRLNFDGSAVVDNPFYDTSDGINAKDYIHSYGYRNPIGGDWFNGRYYVVENGPEANDRLVLNSPGKDFGWDGTAGSLIKDALYFWSRTEAPVDITFDEAGNGYISLSGPTYGTGRIRGKTIDRVKFNEDGTTLASQPTDFVRYTGKGKETAGGVLYIPDEVGFPPGLYWTSLYPDDPELGPTGIGARIYRVYEVADPVPVFDPAQYGASYIDLITGIGYNLETLTQHYQNNAKIEGRQQDLFDEYRYIASYADLIPVFALNGAAATQHYITSGYFEGRQVTFDPFSYMSLNPDVAAAFNSNPILATEHYIKYGYSEGRRVT